MMKTTKTTIETTITDYEWNESTRPILMIDEAGLSIRLHVGGAASLAKLADIELTATDLEGLVYQLEGYRDIFETAIEHLRGKQPQA